MSDMYWEPDTEYPVCDWKAEVAADETRLGYWDWIEAQHELEMTHLKLLTRRKR